MKRTLPLLFSALLLASSLLACGGAASSPAPASGETQADAAASPAETEAEKIRSCRFIRSFEPEGGLSRADLVRRIGGIDIGESEAIMLTKALSADLLIIDEVKGRRAAIDAGVRITGTIGVLLVAFEKKLLTAGEIEECVSGLRSAGRHIGEKHFEKLLGMIRR